MSRCLVVIPARGGSVGVPRKNLQKVGGIPLVALAVQAARSARRVDAVAVSTDDAQIAECAEAFGALVIPRPTDLSGSTASSEDAIVHALDTVAECGGFSPTDDDVVVMLQCTAPFVTAGDIDGILGPVLGGSAQSAFAACCFNHYIWEQDKSQGAVGIGEPPGPRLRRQDAPARFLEAGSAYAMRVGPFRQERQRFCGKTAIHEVPAKRVFEIDTPAELERARRLWPEVFPAVVAARLPDPLEAIVFDFDGVMTDDRVLVSQDGEECVHCSRADGLGLERLRKTGLKLLVLSKERNPVVTARCRKLGIEVLQGRDEKLTDLRAWADSRGLDAGSMIYVGNDINDLECMGWVGLSAAPCDAHPDVLGAVDIVLPRPGGRGAVRAIADLVLD
ncbi:cytidylyltransferase domain-containing protein [Wenzhouxiangella sp. EGI_FJ10409]|uniref:cytidylyltransferase domain-containing protein n=1 Tax=Wenzhouxiangella sp. EGI_FJ10409 TaxID=3243767 RepID=UPI0035DB9792